MLQCASRGKADLLDCEVSWISAKLANVNPWLQTPGWFIKGLPGLPPKGSNSDNLLWKWYPQTKPSRGLLIHSWHCRSSMVFEFSAFWTWLFSSLNHGCHSQLYPTCPVSNSSDWWVSVSASGSEPKAGSGTRTLEPWNLLLGCQAGLILWRLSRWTRQDVDPYKLLHGIPRRKIDEELEGLPAYLGVLGSISSWDFSELFGLHWEILQNEGSKRAVEKKWKFSEWQSKGVRIQWSKLTRQQRNHSHRETPNLTLSITGDDDLNKLVTDHCERLTNGRHSGHLGPVEVANLHQIEVS